MDRMDQEFKSHVNIIVNMNGETVVLLAFLHNNHVNLIQLISVFGVDPPRLASLRSAPQGRARIPRQGDIQKQAADPADLATLGFSGPDRSETRGGNPRGGGRSKDMG